MFESEKLRGRPASKGDAGGSGARRMKRNHCKLKEMATWLADATLFDDMVNVERRIDATLMRKRMELVHQQRKPIEALHTLCVHSTHTVTDCPDGTKDVSVSLYGSLLDAPSELLPSLITSLTLTMDDHSITWTPGSEADIITSNGFTMSRKFQAPPVRCSATLVLKESSMQYELSRGLSTLLGMDTGTIDECVDALWLYIKAHNLQSADERQLIRCNAPLEQLFKTATIQLSSLRACVVSELAHPAAVTLDLTAPARTFHVSLRLKASRRPHQINSALSSETVTVIDQIDREINGIMDTLAQRSVRRQLLTDLSESPGSFLTRMVASQSSDVATMRGLEGDAAVHAQPARAFHHPWVAEAVHRYIADQLQSQAQSL